MRVISFPAGALETNCYILTADSHSDCIIIDPGQDSLRQLQPLLVKKSLKPVAVLLTHGHFDHVWDLFATCAFYKIPAYIHSEDRGLLTDPLSGLGANVASFLRDFELKEPEEIIDVADGDILELANLRIEVIHIPGHTPGSVGYVIRSLEDSTHTADCNATENVVVFGGDVLFQGSIGRSDFPGGNGAELLRSISQRLMTFPDASTVYPGHGPATTIGHERHSNPFL